MLLKLAYNLTEIQQYVKDLYLELSGYNGRHYI